ncbi:MAG: leucine-rich repeat domain-containing protein [Acutalibacteraceae bacterium]|nr:leucine-rich repeat domain-containing protein [Acutalibacteraceae bacterium]
MKGKKLLSLILSALMIQSIAVATAVSSSAADIQQNASQAEMEKISSEANYNGYNYYVNKRNGVTVTGYTGTDGNLVIPSEIDGLPVNLISGVSFAGNAVIKSVTIPDTVEEVSYGTFQGCKNLTEVVIGSGITYMGPSVFADCTSLQTVVISEGSTSVGPGMFSNCKFLSAVVMPSTLRKIGNAAVYNNTLTDATVFRGCPSYLTLYGDRGTYAEKFANANGVRFIAENMPSFIPPTICGDISLDLEETNDNIFTGDIDLEPGAYSFNIKVNSIIRGYNYTYNDGGTINFSAGYKAPTTLNATGGRYRFTYYGATQTLKIQRKDIEEIVELFGDIKVDLVKSSGSSTVYTGSARLEAGTYSFKINEKGTKMGLGYTFNDVVYGAQYNSAWSGSTIFNATGGIYSISYDTATDKLTFKHAPKGLGNVRVFGDINLPLASQGYYVYSATKTLDVGTYQFRIDALGKTVCNGSEFTNGMNGVQYNPEWKAATTFNVTEKQKFTFIFDARSNKIKVFNYPIDTTKVLVAFEDSSLELTSTDGENYTATTELEAGTYSFRMDEFGVTLGYGGTYSDNINAIKYSEGYVSATTLKATGGSYTFSYNIKTDELTVAKA